MMIAEIIRESTSTNNMSSVTSSQVLRWSKRGEAQRSLRMIGKIETKQKFLIPLLHAGNKYTLPKCRQHYKYQESTASSNSSNPTHPPNNSRNLSIVVSTFPMDLLFQDFGLLLSSSATCSHSMYKFHIAI